MVENTCIPAEMRDGGTVRLGAGHRRSDGRPKGKNPVPAEMKDEGSVRIGSPHRKRRRVSMAVPTNMKDAGEVRLGTGHRRP